MTPPAGTTDADGAGFDLDRFTPYLLNRVAAAIVAAFEPHLAPHGLTIRKWRVLAALWHHGTVGLGELARHTSIEQSTLSRMVGALAEAGLARRDRDAADSRAVRITLTDAGRALTARLIGEALATEARVLAGLAPDEVDHLHRLLVRLYANMTE